MSFLLLMHGVPVDRRAAEGGRDEPAVDRCGVRRPGRGLPVGLGQPSLLGLEGPTPITSIIIVIMFPILFGLSMDYEVFLLSRIREEYDRTGDNVEAVARGLAGTGRVITSAALIMIVVFLSFVASPVPSLKMLGLGLATAILVDATIVRMVLVPATMALLGKANWWLPAWLDRVLPQLTVEGPADDGVTGASRRTAPPQPWRRGGGGARRPLSCGRSADDPGHQLARIVRAVATYRERQPHHDPREAAGTDSVSATLVKPALSNSARVPTNAIVRSTFLPWLSTGIASTAGAPCSRARSTAPRDQRVRDAAAAEAGLDADAEDVPDRQVVDGLDLGRAGDGELGARRDARPSRRPRRRRTPGRRAGPCGGTASGRTRRARGRPARGWSCESTRWLRHQQTLPSGFFFGPRTAATSGSCVAGRTSMVIPRRYPSTPTPASRRGTRCPTRP